MSSFKNDVLLEKIIPVSFHTKGIFFKKYFSWIAGNMQCVVWAHYSSHISNSWWVKRTRSRYIKVLFYIWRVLQSSLTQIIWDLFKRDTFLSRIQPAFALGDAMCVCDTPQPYVWEVLHGCGFIYHYGCIDSLEAWFKSVFLFLLIFTLNSRGWYWYSPSGQIRLRSQFTIAYSLCRYIKLSLRCHTLSSKY